MSRYYRVPLGDEAVRAVEAHPAAGPSEAAPSAPSPSHSAMSIGNRIASAAVPAVPPPTEHAAVNRPAPKVTHPTKAHAAPPRTAVPRDSTTATAAVPARSSTRKILLIGAAALAGGGILVWLLTRPRRVIERVYR